MDAEAYRNQIDQAIREMAGETILNGSHAHASIIIERMFAHAKSSVMVLTRKFDPRIYGTVETVEQARLFLGQPERKCLVLVEEFDQRAFDNHPFVEALLPYFEAGNLQVRQLTAEMAKVVNVNYSIMDESGFRFEEDKKEAVAVASFGKGTEKFVSSLKALFSRVWDKSTQVLPTPNPVSA